MKLLGIAFGIFALIILAIIIIVAVLLTKINNDCVNETNDLVTENYKYKNYLKSLKCTIRTLKQQQFYNNTTIPLNVVLNSIDKFEKELKKELSSTDQSVR